MSFLKTIMTEKHMYGIYCSYHLTECILRDHTFHHLHQIGVWFSPHTLPFGWLAGFHCHTSASGNGKETHNGSFQGFRMDPNFSQTIHKSNFDNSHTMAWGDCALIMRPPFDNNDNGVGRLHRQCTSYVMVYCTLEETTTLRGKRVLPLKLTMGPRA